MIAIVDYGLGNTKAFANIYKRLNIPAILASTADALEKADHIILPGVGSFDWAIQCLDNAGLRLILNELVKIVKLPVLGVCVGMQIMSQSSEEGSKPGLGWINAEVKRFKLPVDKETLVLPHMGWNDIHLNRKSELFNGLEDDARFYFLHSYYLVPNEVEVIVASAEYGGSFACSVQSENIYGVQFHPEKSHGWGIQLLKNFAEI